MASRGDVFELHFRGGGPLDGDVLFAEVLPSASWEVEGGLYELVSIRQATGSMTSARYEGTGRAGALELLRQNGAATAALLHSLSEAQLDTSTVFFGHSMTLETLAQNGLVTNIVSFNVGVEIGQGLALTAVLIGLSYWRTRGGFLRHAFVTNTALMAGGFILIGYQLAGYFISA